MLIHAACDYDLVPARSGGAQRSFGLARGLARAHRVRALCVVPNRATGPERETRSGVEIVRRKAWHTSLAWRLERWGLAPLFSAEGGHRANRARYLDALGPGADVLAADLNLAALLAAPGAPLRVHTSQNVEYDRFLESGPRVAGHARWAERLRRLEGAAVGRAHLTIACTDEDAARLRELYGAGPDRIEVVPNGYDESTLRPPTSDERARARAALGFDDADYVAIFVGADWGPNRAALARLVDRILPSLATERIRLLVVGAVARALRGRREPWLVAPGEVADLLPLLHAADAGVNPVTGGGGSNVKVPAYLASGLAAITTPFGLRGYAPLAPHVTEAAPEAFADALRARPPGWAARGAAAPAALAEYAWGRLGERLADLFAARLAHPGAPARGAA